MTGVRRAVSAAAQAATPRLPLIRLRIRVSLDMLLTLAVSILAIALVVGFQVVSRLGRWTDGRG